MLSLFRPRKKAEAERLAQEQLAHQSELCTIRLACDGLTGTL
jgi:hypothetical protein